ncbi:MAG: S-layer homology domain-containing protein [Cyanobacteria bacterium J06632_22]
MSQGTPDPNPRDRDWLSRYSLSSDEMIALFIAFLTLGSVFFWGVSRSGWNWIGGDRLFATGETALQGAGQGADGLGSRLGAGRSDADDEDAVGLGPLRGGDGASSDAADGNTRALLDNGDSNAGNAGTRPRASFPGGGALPGVTGPTVGNNADNPALPRQTAQPANPAAPATPLEPSQEALTFLDVPEDYWAKPFVDALSSRGLMAGFDDGTFKPDDPVTRAQLARVITGSFDLSSEEAAVDFTDIATDYWAYGAIQDSVKGGFMNGFPDESFQPDISVPRVQVLTALVTGLETEAAGDVAADVDRYIDAAKIPDWAVSKVAAATQSGLVVNYPELNQLAPNQPATRAEVAAMVYQALVYQGRIDPIESEYLVAP